MAYDRAQMVHIAQPFVCRYFLELNIQLIYLSKYKLSQLIRVTYTVNLPFKINAIPIELNLRKEKWLVISMYRRPLESLSCFLDSLTL